MGAKFFRRREEPTATQPISSGCGWTSYARFFDKRRINYFILPPTKLEEMRLNTFIESYKNRKVLIVRHIESDLDTTTSALALLGIFKNGLVAAMPTPYRAVEKLLHDFAHLSHRVQHAPSDFSGIEGCIILDTACRDRLPGWIFAPGAPPILAIVDHREKISSEHFEGSILNINNPTFSSTAELLVHYGGIPRDKQTALLLAIGILADTSNFTRKTTSQTYTIFNQLLNTHSISFPAVRNYVFEIPTCDEMVLIQDAYRRSATYRIGQFVINLIPVGTFDPEILKFVSTRAMDYTDLAVSYASAPSSPGTEATRLSIKCREAVPIDCGMLITALKEAFHGQGGGHRAGGAAFLYAPAEPLLESIKSFVEENLKPGE